MFYTSTGPDLSIYYKPLVHYSENFNRQLKCKFFYQYFAFVVLG